MDIDEMLSQMNRDIASQLSAVNNAMSGIDNAYSSDGNALAESTPTDVKEFMFCPECGTKLPTGSMFCSNCGTRLVDDEMDESYEDNDSDSYEGCGFDGIIWTDTKIISQKYDGLSQDEVCDSITSFISECEGYGVSWTFLDMAEHQHELDEGTWMDYSDVLDRFMKDNDIKPSPKLSLFIIGGNDVIPQPAERNPCGDPSDEYQEFVYADFYYCFYGKLPLDFLDFNKARCNVARLPLEMGNIEDSTFDDDIDTYFNKTLHIMKNDGISIGNAVMTSNVDWIPASREMSRNLPTPHMDDVDGETLDNMYLSPGVMADGMDEDLEERYCDSLNEADMLVFNLHGACAPEDSSFYYSGGEAFSIDMLDETNAKIFNTVACWGGRYIKYRRENSMLLNAIYNYSTMLYAGSCVPALGKCGDYQCDSTWRIQPAAYSETFMARFSEYECIGKMPAGEAFLKAKCDYYNSSRSIEDDECTLGTVLMFNLFGCPQLKTNPDVDAIENMQEEDGSKFMRMPFRKMQKQVVMKGAANKGQPLRQTQDGAGSHSLLGDIRGAVDANLRAIHQTITENLYNQLGVEPRELFSVEKYSTTDAYGNLEKGYLYNYRKQKGCIQTSIRAKMDEHGNLLDAIQTK